METNEKLQVFLQGKDIPQNVLTELPAKGRVVDIIEAARTHGLQVIGGEELLVWIEGEDEPLNPELTLVKAGIRKNSRVHVHTCRHIDVTVVFNGRTITKPFSPAQTIEKVKKWADHELVLSETDANDHVLQISGTIDQPDEDKHLGALVHFPQCSVSFDLVPKSRIQG